MSYLVKKEFGKDEMCIALTQLEFKSETADLLSVNH